MAEGSVRVWATAISTNRQNGRKIVFRYAKELRPAFNRHSQPIRVIVVWKYCSESGQPEASEHQQMNLLEDSIARFRDQENFATLAIVSTGEGLREWTYYVHSEDEFIARLDAALTEMPPFPIEIHVAHDRDWEAYEQFRRSVAVPN
jgi:hypothetical protein